MGGRGTFAAGRSVPYTYKKVDEIEGVKVLKGINGEHSLPESSHTSNAYIKLYPDGTFQEMRIYDDNHVLTLEIGYHKERSLTGNNTEKILHYHLYDEAFSKSRTAPFTRTRAARLTDEMMVQYKKYFRGVKGI